MLICDGIPTKEDLDKIIPSEERLSGGPVAIIECFQEIPCDPCVKACKRGAITMHHDAGRFDPSPAVVSEKAWTELSQPSSINDLPVVNTELCNGCGVCISFCPGLAIFVIDKSYSEDFAMVKLPYEYVPVPEAGRFVDALDRAGKKLGSFEVKRVTSGGKMNMTYTVSLAVPHELVMDVRGIRI